MPQVTAGTRLGPYEITSRLGAGGMGEVWRAKDTRLDRSVAIKILPSELAHNAQLKVRLEREARAISQLNHPHICTLFDVGDDYLVMELLDGETLAERTSRGPLPLADVLRFGVQIAEALDRAHRAGIVHRDLKPGNVMLTKSGAKLLDFGLARTELTQTVDAEGPTMQVRNTLTEEGTILGTFQYMAPEQLEAQPADSRTDIFALGCVLYEMATGRRAFEGKTKTSLIAAIVTAQPQPISTLQPVTPPAFEHVVQKCLEKDPDARWQSAHDVAEELKWIARETERGEVTLRARRQVPWAVAALLAVTTLAAAGLWIRERSRPASPLAFTIQPPRNADFEAMAISPDGKTLAFVVSTIGAPGNDIVLRSLDSFELKKIATVRAGTGIYWSPDGKWIAYWETGRLQRIPVTGGKPETIARNASYGVGLAWNEDDTIVFARRWGEGLYRVPATGGEPVTLTKLDAARHESLHGHPVFLDDGNHFLFLVHTTGEQQNAIHVGALDGTHRELLRADALAGIARGALLFVRDGGLYAQTFDQKKLALEGKARRILDGIWFSEANAHASVWVTADGAIAYVPYTTKRTIGSWHDTNGRKLAPAYDSTDFAGLSVSRDARKIAVMKLDPSKGANDIHTLDLERGILTRVTGGLADYSSPVWAIAGDRVFFSSDRTGLYDIYSQVEDGTAPPQLLWTSQLDKFATDITPDGRFLLVNVEDPVHRTDIWLLPSAPGGGAPQALISSESNERNGTVSPDGRWLAYVSDRSGRDEVYVRRFPAGRSTQVSTDRGSGPAWSFDSSQLFFAGPNSALMAVTITAAGEVPVPGKPRQLFQRDASQTAVYPSPTDDRLLVTSLPDALDQMTVVNYLRREW